MSEQPTATDEWLRCQDCGDEFLYSTRDQEFYAEKGFTEPKRCIPCRKAKKEARASFGQDK